MTRWTRRKVLHVAVAGAGIGLLPWAGVLAQESRAALLRASKQALVLGNSRYKQAPLKNPLNDAKGMAEALKGVGFGVTLGLDFNQSEMRDAMRAYTGSLAKSKAVGLFYFAGHGAQLGWRNYLIPVDAEIGDVQELRDRGIDLNSLIEGIRQAGNPMNLIILDACRDNPFGSTRRLDQKGLSQLDAPPGTLLAYATAPGNTAIDGEGENGLYTGHLLRQIRVPEAKVEDVFKRVRLAVRRQSNGLQIPWESTSLEEDFWFIPPRALAAAVAEEAAKPEADRATREFEEELALWERIRETGEPGPLEDYLLRHPSGRFAELALLRLDQVLAGMGEKKIQIVSAPENPYTKGTVAANTAYKVRDQYRYRRMDPLTRLEGDAMRRRVTAVTDTEVHFNDGRFVTDLLGNPLRFPNGMVWSPNQTVPTEFAVGRRWSTRFRIITRKGIDAELDLIFRIEDREQVTVPAGTFNAFRVEARGWRAGADGVSVNLHWRRWYAPEQVRLPVATETFNRHSRGRIVASERAELVEFRQS